MISIKRLDLHNRYLCIETSSKEDKQRNILTFLVDKLNCMNDELAINQLSSILNVKFYKNYYERWNSSVRNNNHFITKNARWLNEEISFEIDEILN